MMDDGRMLMSDGRMGELWWDDASGRWEEGRVMVV